MSAPRAVVFGYHAVGVRGLRALQACGVDVRLVVTHTDNPNEKIWFPSLAATAAELDLACIAPEDINAPEVVQRVRACEPDFIFSFYCRQMLKAPLLALPTRGAYNLHGSLLPKYRGRVPVNWAVIRGEQETGATLHVMDIKPDHGPIVDQCAVPILPDDTAAEVFNKVVVAAEIVLMRSVPRLMAGNATLTPLDVAAGSYFSGRKPEDGRIPAQARAAEIHNLVRALARPFPGAFFDTPAGRVMVWRTQRTSHRFTPAAALQLHARDGALWLTTAHGETLRVLEAELNTQATTQALTALHPALPLSISSLAST